jgi:hypothetical protein
VSSQIWVPGAPMPSLEDLVARLNKSIDDFARSREITTASVEIELADGSTYALHKIRPEPGYGFITLCPYPEDEEAEWDGECTPEEVIIQVGAIRRITISEAEEPHSRFGFSVSEEASA